MKLFPYISRKLSQSWISSNSAGKFYLSNSPLSKIADHKDTHNRLLHAGMGYLKADDIYNNGYDFDQMRRNFIPNKLNYFIIIPTLRCNLNCTYCQVSRANEDAVGYDWSEENFNNFLRFFDKYAGDRPKVEIQGGEPLLVFHKLLPMFEELRRLRSKCEIVICTNLQNLPKNFIEDCKDHSLYLSSSLDGPSDIHNKNRNQDESSTSKFLKNLYLCIDELGLEKVSLLPTVTSFDILDDICQQYRDLGLNEIFMRPVNYQGFARKKHKHSKSLADDWIECYLSFLDGLFASNEKSETKLRETYFSIHANRIFDQTYNSHVDFRNPNPVGQDYVVVNYNGEIFPTDEARMLERIGVINLSIGNLKTGFDNEAIDKLNGLSKLENYEQCQVCAYKPFCGIDIVDLISKHGTLDLNMHETDHCKIHMKIFDYIFEKIQRAEPVFLRNLNFSLTGVYEETHITIGKVHD